jgi:hypothetical protein
MGESVIRGSEDDKIGLYQAILEQFWGVLKVGILLKEGKEKIIIELPVNIDRETLWSILNRLEMEEIASQIDLSEEEIWELSEKVKQEWWEKEGEKLLKEKGILIEDAKSSS